MQRTRAELKAFFKKGAIPTESNFGDFVDSAVIQEEDSLLKPANDPLTLRAVGVEERLLLFARSESGGDRTTWQWSQRPPGAPKPGLALGDATTVRLFLDSETGNLGVGTLQPADPLEVAGPIRILSGSNPIRFTAGWSGFASAGTPAKVNNAEISNDTGTYKALMLVGNSSSGTRRVGIWDSLEVYTGGAGAWTKFVVNKTKLWGDGDNEYVTIGAGGAAGIMAYNLHVPWHESENRASIRYGRSGGVSTGHYWDVGVRTKNAFSFWSPNANTVPLFLDSAGNVGVAGVTNPGARLDVGGLVRIGLDEGGSGAKSISFDRVAGDEVNAGKIAFRPAWNPKALGIVGAGVPPNRTVSIWDDVIIAGDITIAGGIGSKGYPAKPKQSGWGGGLHTWDVEAEATIWARHGVVTGPRDLAETYPVNEVIDAGEVVALDPGSDCVVRADAATGHLVLGIVSSEPGFLLGDPREPVVDGDVPRQIPVALSGCVPCKVTDENGPIERGDLLTAASRPGYAMKAIPEMIQGVEYFRPGTLLGKALAPMSSGEGKIQVFVNLR